MFKYIFLIVGCILIFGCSDIESSIGGSLNGTWIETEFKTDTIEFDDQSAYLWLYRGTELVNNEYLPVAGSGPYDYKIQGDSIYINAAWSSLFRNKAYYFKKEENILIIGNFYDTTLNKALLNFERAE